MSITDTKTHSLLLIQKAAKGGMIGVLNDWPALRRALLHSGVRMPDDAPMDKVARECQEYLAYRTLLSDDIDSED